ncbi:hypothetical protein NKW54_08650 [Acetobacter cerevisiae]|uniref:Uncharacterized protein n=1 Tax=Acetobacter cerevisiae TaxID=178900 RepID=A0A149UTW4_9PROT|nr:hypothetical protein [Acetobacter cerevisiae]KXV71397.1 hypothetical protein AD952_09225 [Acetobacter cerevisiae]MCP1246008.1 hypothetical protein [Acetobacter cerevisiae]MCP1255726.1 hypothetical protein [Acetobacter cerevisiae]
MTAKPTAVVVRLPLSDSHVLALLDAYTGDKETTNPKMEATLLAIGTPVVGGELEILGYVPNGNLWDDARFGVRNLYRTTHDGAWTRAVTGLADAHAALAAAQAEIGRLRDALDDAKRFHEDQDKAFSKQPPSAQGQWHRHQHQEQIERIEEALKGPAA